MNARAGLALRVALGGVLLYAGMTKASSTFAFAETVANFRIFPAQANQVLAVLLPWWEISAGVLLILGLWVRPAAALAAVLFTSFALAVGSALLRGLDIDCGCFGSGVTSRTGLLTLALDVAGLLAAGGVIRSRPEEPAVGIQPVPPATDPAA